MKSKTKRNKYRFIYIVGIITLLVALVVCGYYYGYKLPRDYANAMSEFRSNKEIEAAILNDELTEKTNKITELGQKIEKLESDLGIKTQELSKATSKDEIAAICKAKVESYKQKSAARGVTEEAMKTWLYKSSAYNNCLEGKDPNPIQSSLGSSNGFHCSTTKLGGIFTETDCY